AIVRSLLARLKDLRFETRLYRNSAVCVGLVPAKSDDVYHVLSRWCSAEDWDVSPVVDCVI
ncbi:hypothetical protein AVEN_152230-1, partial [Araneus ventricosus]